MENRGTISQLHHDLCLRDNPTTAKILLALSVVKLVGNIWQLTHSSIPALQWGLFDVYMSVFVVIVWLGALVLFKCKLERFFVLLILADALFGDVIRFRRTETVEIARVHTVTALIMWVFLALVSLYWILKKRRRDQQEQDAGCPTHRGVR